MSDWRDNVPVVPITQAQVDDNLQCTICLEDFKYSEQVRRLDCSHVYHDTCIGAWFITHNICPMCRRLTINGGETNENYSENEMTTDNEDDDEDEMETDEFDTDDDDVDVMSIFGSGSIFIPETTDSENQSFPEDSVTDEDIDDSWEEVSEHSDDNGGNSEEEEEEGEENNSEPAAENSSTLNLTVEMNEASASESEQSWQSASASADEDESVVMSDSD